MMCVLITLVPVKWRQVTSQFSLIEELQVNYSISKDIQSERRERRRVGQPAGKQAG